MFVNIITTKKAIRDMKTALWGGVSLWSRIIKEPWVTLVGHKGPPAGHTQNWAVASGSHWIPARDYWGRRRDGGHACHGQQDNGHQLGVVTRAIKFEINSELNLKKRKLKLKWSCVVSKSLCVNLKSVFHQPLVRDGLSFHTRAG